MFRAYFPKEHNQCIREKPLNLYAPEDAATMRAFPPYDNLLINAISWLKRSYFYMIPNLFYFVKLIFHLRCSISLTHTDIICMRNRFNTFYALTVCKIGQIYVSCNLLLRFVQE